MDKRHQGIDATSMDFARYDQVRKPVDYRLAEASGAETFDESFCVRTCDYRLAVSSDPADRARFAQTFGEALREIGFAVLEHTGIDAALYDDAERHVFELFESTPLADKLRFRAARHGSINQGYFPVEQTSDIHPDLVEGWVFCRRAFDCDDVPGWSGREFWPDVRFEACFRQICRAHEHMILPLMRSVLTYFGCHPKLYDQRLSHTNYALRLNYYPELSEADERSGAGRLLGHEDVTLFTLLPAPSVEGLQALHRGSGKWVRIDAPRGALIVNSGDYLQRMTNDVIPSTTHRVSKPRDPSLRRRARASFPFNVYLWEDEILEVLPCFDEPRYPPISALTFHTRTTSKYYGDDYAVN